MNVRFDTDEKVIMSKKAEYNIGFYKKQIPNMGIANIFDVNNSPGEYKRLGFIAILGRLDVSYIIEVIEKIQQGQVYDPDFLTSSDVYQAFNVQYANNFLFVDGYSIIHINDLKILLEEWIDFCNS